MQELKLKAKQIADLVPNITDNLETKNSFTNALIKLTEAVFWGSHSITAVPTTKVLVTLPQFTLGKPEILCIATEIVELLVAYGNDAFATETAITRLQESLNFLEEII